MYTYFGQRRGKTTLASLTLFAFSRVSISGVIEAIEFYLLAF